MKIGICLPYMKAGLGRDDYLDWFRAVDDGPFHSVSCGERVHGPTYDMRVVLSAAAAPKDGARGLAETLGVETDRYGFIAPADPAISAVEST